jgi:hypothetical protein
LVTVDDVQSSVATVHKEELHRIDSTNNHFLLFAELNEGQEGDLLEKGIDPVADRPLPLLFVLDDRFLEHQPFEYLLTHLALLIQKSEKLVPRYGILNQRLRDAFLDVRGRTALERRNQLRNNLDRQLLLRISVDESALLESLVDSEQVVRREVQRMEGVLQNDLSVFIHRYVITAQNAAQPEANLGKGFPGRIGAFCAVEAPKRQSSQRDRQK